MAKGKPKDGRTDAERKARAFVSENRPLLDDPDASILVRGEIYRQGAAVEAELREEVMKAAKRSMDAADRLQDAVGNRTPPKRLSKLEEENTKHLRRYEEALAERERLKAFVDEAYASLNLNEDEPAQAEEPEDASAVNYAREEPPKRRGFFSRIFG